MVKNVKFMKIEKHEQVLYADKFLLIYIKQFPKKKKKIAKLASEINKSFDNLRRRVDKYASRGSLGHFGPRSASIIDSDESTIIMGGSQQDDDDDTKSSNADEVVNNDANEPLVAVQTFMEKAKFYTSLVLGTTAILAVFAFLFAIPFIVEPAISTILADFSPHTVACIVTEHVYAEGLKNCSWASCREGCTSAATKCHQIKVNYSKLPYDEFIKNPPGSIPWDVADTKFFINTEGCGYPPRVNCTEFAKQFGRGNLGKIFPCYYSRTYPETVVSRYSWDENLQWLILALVTPILLFIISLGVLCYWYCPPVGKTCGGPGRNLIDKYARKEDILAEDEFEEDEEEY